MALPVRVYLKKLCTPMTLTVATAITHNRWGSMPAAPMRTGCVPLNGGRITASGPHNSLAPPFRTREAPMVAMISVIIEAAGKGRIVSRSTASPTIVTATTATTAATARGKPNSVRATAPIPPSITSSPWAKLITPVAL